MILVIHAHPYASLSRAGKRLAAVAREAPGVVVHPLYERYPDFDIDIVAEQEALRAAQVLVWLHPVYWYGMPSLMKHWVDNVLARGFAYGKDGDALHGKHCLWTATTGGTDENYAPGGMHERPFADFVAPFEQTAKFCGMHWHPPLILHGAHTVPDAALDAFVETFRARLLAFHDGRIGDTHAG